MDTYGDDSSSSSDDYDEEEEEEAGEELHELVVPSGFEDGLRAFLTFAWPLFIRPYRSEWTARFSLVCTKDGASLGLLLVERIPQEGIPDPTHQWLVRLNTVKLGKSRGYTFLFRETTRPVPQGAVCCRILSMWNKWLWVYTDNGAGHPGGLQMLYNVHATMSRAALMAVQRRLARALNTVTLVLRRIGVCKDVRGLIRDLVEKDFDWRYEPEVWPLEYTPWAHGATQAPVDEE